MRQYRPESADRGIQSHFSLKMSVNEDIDVFVQSKNAVAAHVPYGECLVWRLVGVLC